jgi:hypothetical protein
MPAYEALWEETAKARAARQTTPGDPQATGPAILEIVDAEDPPLRIFFGEAGLGMTRAEYERRIATWEQWDALSQRAHG